MQPVVFQKIAVPTMKFGIHPKSLKHFWLAIILFLLFQQYLVGGVVVAAMYMWFFKKSQDNPYFIEEKEARKRYPKTQNTQQVEGNWYVG